MACGSGEFHELPLGRWPWQDGTFDVVAAFKALFFARDPDEAFEEAVRVRKDHVVVCQWHPEIPGALLVVGRAVRGTSGRRGAMLRGFLSVGSHQRVIASEEEEEVAEKSRPRLNRSELRTVAIGFRTST